MINKKKLVKATVVGIGIYGLMELCSIIGEAQALAGMRDLYPDEVDEILDTFDNAEQFKGLVPLFNIVKVKIVGKVSKYCIENDVFK